ncbi:hypothetical protein EVAR_9271_1 [Eumeta japonica]|uniref:Uncharacterized protein n=1 Tax=Eumeta variegata TaxID=151549 RepID=A0A4C1TNT2_EUMVA|nr:hypothetical protein EVAR_9271_1 [Eumeta japonica]
MVQKYPLILCIRHESRRTALAPRPAINYCRWTVRVRAFVDLRSCSCVSVVSGAGSVVKSVGYQPQSIGIAPDHCDKFRCDAAPRGRAESPRVRVDTRPQVGRGAGGRARLGGICVSCTRGRRVPRIPRAAPPNIDFGINSEYLGFGSFTTAYRNSERLTKSDTVGSFK